jgi:aminopeptidase N
VSGKPLDWFFAQWLNRPGVPKIEGSWRYDAMKKQSRSRSARPAAEPYRVNVEVGIVARAASCRR